jgi:hypothetical protein
MIFFSKTTHVNRKRHFKTALKTTYSLMYTTVQALCRKFVVVFVSSR